MEYKRSDRHFQLSPDPRQPQADDQAVAADESASSVSASDTATEPITFEPAPPSVPEVSPPVIESMQTSAPEIAPVVPETPQQPIMTAPVESHVLPHEAVPQPKRGVPTKFVVAGGLALVFALIGSIVWQQMAISQLKNERRVLGEQVMQVNPISAGTDVQNKQ